MPRRKRRKARGRRRRVGAAFSLKKGGMTLNLLSVAGGFLMGNAINAQIDKFLPKTTDPVTNTQVPNQTIGYVAQLGVGGMLLMSKRARPVVKIAGGVLAGAGLKRALKSFGVITGYQATPVIGRSHMRGYQSVPVIGRMPPQLAGIPAQLRGYRPAGSGLGAYIPAGSGVMGAVDNGSGVTQNSGSGYMN